MQISKKHLFGIGGLVAVAATVAYASTLPAPDADATGSVSGQVKVSVNVYGENPEVRITTIKDGDVFVDGNIDIGAIYTVAESLDYQLCKNYGEANEYCANLGTNGTYTPETIPESGERAFGFDLDSDPNLGFGDYVLKVVNHAYNGTVEDAVSFKYVPIKITTVGTAENGDPIVEVEYAAKINSFDLQAYDKDDKPLFDNALNISVDNPGVSGTKQVTLPFASYGAASGDYTVSAQGRGADGTIYTGQIAYTDVKYQAPDAPEVPKTGGLLQSLNITKSDYIITGVIVFVLATAFAVRTLKKRNNRR
ncbi:hypothetical protein IJJ18_03210 [Candidatus Saccharibacteria bacterium]|nr:hypothetical protein [Candidatus Saccharibacteria bacterium]